MTENENEQPQTYIAMGSMKTYKTSQNQQNAKNLLWTSTAL